MPLAHAARNLIAKMLVGEQTSSQDYNSSNAWIHVGSSTGTFDPTHNSMLSTGAIAATMDATYPSRATNVLTFRSTYTTSQANFDWNEWGVKNSSATATGSNDLLNRKQEALGTKASTQAWQITATLSVTT
jgi:hypothetical protein